MKVDRLAPAVLLVALMGCGSTKPDPAAGPAPAAAPLPAASSVAGQADSAPLPSLAPPTIADAPSESSKPAVIAAQPAGGAPGAPAAEANTPDAFIEQAVAAVKEVDMDGAIQLLEKALEKDPKHRRALSLLGEVAQRYGQSLIPTGDGARLEPIFMKSAQAFHTLKDTYKEKDPRFRRLYAIAFYNEACVLCRRMKKDQALKALMESVDDGFQDASGMKTDPDLEPLRDAPQFADLLKQVEANQATTPPPPDGAAPKAEGP